MELHNEEILGHAENLLFNTSQLHAGPNAKWSKTLYFSRGNQFFSTTDSMEDWIFFSTCNVSMTLKIYICDFFQFKLSDSRLSLCRPDGCINIRIKILLKHLGMQVLLAKCWKSHRIANMQISFIFFFLKPSGKTP